MDSESLIKKIEKVLKSDLTPYKIAKEVGYASAHPIHKLIQGQSKIEYMSLEKATAFEKLHDSNFLNVNMRGVITNEERRSK